MPNAVRRLARLFVKRVQCVASSTSSPPVVKATAEADKDPETTKNEADGALQAEVHTQIEVDVQRDLADLSTSLETLECVDDVEDDVMRELETLKTLRIEEALEESRKMQESFRETRSIGSTKRLMKELRNLQKASAVSDGAFDVRLCSNDRDEEEESDLQQWEVKFYKFDESSQLWRSMQEYGIDCVKFHVTFPTDFPFSPPFLRLVSPYIENGFVMNGGAICLEVLTNQGWSSAYTVEALLVQVAASLSHGGAVISKHQKRKQHKLTKKRAQVEFQRIVKIHNKYGWVKLERGEG